PALEPGRAGTPVLHRVFLMADRSAEQRAELRSAGQPGAAVPTWFFFQIGMRAGSAQYPSHTGNVLQAVHAGSTLKLNSPERHLNYLANSNISGPDRRSRNSPIRSTAALVLYSKPFWRRARPLLPDSL